MMVQVTLEPHHIHSHLPWKIKAARKRFPMCLLLLMILPMLFIGRQKEHLPVQHEPNIQAVRTPVLPERYVLFAILLTAVLILMLTIGANGLTAKMESISVLVRSTLPIRKAATAATPLQPVWQIPLVLSVGISMKQRKTIAILTPPMALF